MKLVAVTRRSALQLDDADAARPDDAPSDKTLVHSTEKLGKRIGELQRVFYADARHALLVVLQGRDASGKDGAIRHVFSTVNPQGCVVTSFKAPTELERRHDFLWRVHQVVPPRGMIGVFNRSHYEDVLVPRVHDELSDEECERRFREINDFERMLSEQRVVILKFMLHISADEQKRRLNKRLQDPDKNWKFQSIDLDDRSRWERYTEAYRALLRATSTSWAPWYVVPSDSKKVRSWLIARRIVDTLEKLDLRYPPPRPEIAGMEIV
jgi:PPK2 family polyphosphate:nucleotide phosphotransferase